MIFLLRLFVTLDTLLITTVFTTRWETFIHAGEAIEAGH